MIVESEKAALALLALADGTGESCWPWHRRRIGLEAKDRDRITPDGGREAVTGPSPTFDWVVWQGRKVIVAFDSNVAGRRDLEKARPALAEELRKRGAQVFIASVPKRDGVNGPDDLIAVAGDRAALEMLDRTAPFAPAWGPPVRTGFVLTRWVTSSTSQTRRLITFSKTYLSQAGFRVSLQSRRSVKAHLREISAWRSPVARTSWD